MPILLYVYDKYLAYHISHVWIKNLSTPLSYMLIILFANIIFMFSYRLLLYKKYYRLLSYETDYINFFGKKCKFHFIKGKQIYFCGLIIITLYLLVVYILKKNNLGYGVKSTSLITDFLILTSTNIILNNILYIRNNIRHKKDLNTYNNIIIILTSVLSILFVLFSVRRSSRGELMTMIISLVFIYFHLKERKLNFKLIIKGCTIVLLFVIISQFLRLNRGGVREVYNFNLDEIFSFFDLNVFLDQDYSVPGYTLFYAIDNGVINPLRVIMSNIGNGIFFLDYSTLSGFISRAVVPEGGFGLAGYILYEGYSFCGVIGAVLMPAFIILCYKLYYNLFLKYGSYNYKLYMCCLIVNNVIFNVIRGQSFYFFKALYMYFLPGIIFYVLLNNSKESKE